MNKRIKFLREEMGMSRAAFGDRLGISGDMVNNMERGRVEIREDRIKLICSTFSINEEWLRTGTGEPKIKLTKNQKVADFMNSVMELPDTNIKKRAIDGLARLKESDWEFIEKIIDTLKGGE